MNDTTKENLMSNEEKSRPSSAPIEAPAVPIPRERDSNTTLILDTPSEFGDAPGKEAQS